MSKTKANPPTVLPDDADSLLVHFYISEGIPRVTFEFPSQGRRFDHAISEYNTLSGAQKTALRALLTALRDETFTLEGYL
jgi:hypothetical protein